MIVCTYIALFHFSSTVLKWLNNLCFSTPNNPARHTQKIPVAKKNLSMHEKQNDLKKKKEKDKKLQKISLLQKAIKLFLPLKLYKCANYCVLVM